MIAMRLGTLILLTMISTAQQTAIAPPADKRSGITEPALPVIYQKACPFEGCTFRQWTVNKQSKMYSSWQSNRNLVATLKAGEKVTGLTGVLISRKPDRFLVKQPTPYFSLKVGDVILQYAEWGEGAADLWAKGVWYKSFDWGQTEEGDLILSDDNVTLVEHGSREWWVQVKTLSGKMGWVHASGNFDGMDALAEKLRCPDPTLREVEIGGNVIIGGVGLHKQPLKFARVRVYSSPGNKVWSGKTDKQGWFRTRTLVPGEYRLEVDGWGSTTVRLNPELDKAPAGYSKQAGTWNVLLMDEGCAGYTHIVN
jgi:hypothetical protein